MKKKQYFSKKTQQQQRQIRVSNFEDRPSHKKVEYAKVNGGVFVYSKPLSVTELSKAINVPAPAIIKFLFMQGKAVTINQILDDEMIGTICLQFNYDFRKEKVVDAEHFEQIEIHDDPKNLMERPPVVTVMGHVDHGKTTLIDAIRSSHVAESEAGGISQAIGAYQKEFRGKKITFIDTPGHAAFAAMRARGASVTDIVILVVAADDGVMPQTVEAIGHAKAAGVPIIVAINKIDKEGSNPHRVVEELMAHDVIAEEFGGDVICCEVSAKKSIGIDNLLDAVLLKAEMLELKANPNRYASGTVLEANLDRGEGPKATLLVQNGTLQATDYVVVGEIYGKIRRMTNEFRQTLKTASPSTPVSVTGLSAVPSAGDRFMAFPTEKEAREIAEKRALTKQAEQRSGSAAMHQYNFPPFSVGEVGRMGSPGRREIGHGALGERALSYVLPDEKAFPYTIRCVADVVESNGSSSQASICANCMSLMAAGVPIKGIVSGIAMGLISSGPLDGKHPYAILTDIQGLEDHFGDMDFKCAGTEKGITALQMDIKIHGVTREVLSEALDQANKARAQIREDIKKAIPEPRKEVSEYAPKMVTFKIDVDKIRDVIGQGGKVINDIIAKCNEVKIDVEEDGTITIYHTDKQMIAKAKQMIDDITREAKVGEIFEGKVTRVEDYGAFVNLFGDTDGLCHVSRLDWKYVDNASNVVKVGETLKVVVIGLDEKGKVKVSHREFLDKPEGYVERPERPAGEHRPSGSFHGHSGGDFHNHGNGGSHR